MRVVCYSCMSSHNFKWVTLSTTIKYFVIIVDTEGQMLCNHFDNACQNLSSTVVISFSICYRLILYSLLLQWASVDVSTACNAKVKTGFGKPSRHGVPCTAMDDSTYPTPCNWFWRLVLMFKEHSPLCNNSIEEKKISYQSKHGLYFLVEAWATSFGLINSVMSCQPR